MAEFVSMRQSLRIEWKVKNIFSVNNLESEFSFSGSKYQLLLQRYGSGGSERIVIHMSRINSNETHLHEIVVKTYIEGRNRNVMFLFQGINSSKDYILWSKYTSDLRKHEGKILTDGIVAFVCELTTEAVSEDKTEREVSTQTAEDLNPLPCFECLSLDLQHLLDDNILSDVTLKCGDRTIPAHRNILSARSEVFHAMLRNDMAESRSGIIEISDMEPSILDQLIQYIYSGRTSELSPGIAQELYAAADRYAIVSLKILCGNFMKENLTKENACIFLALSDAHGDKDLKDCALSFIAKTDLLRDEENWFGFHEEYPNLAAEVIHHVYKAKCIPT